MDSWKGRARWKTARLKIHRFLHLVLALTVRPISHTILRYDGKKDTVRTVESAPEYKKM